MRQREGHSKDDEHAAQRSRSVAAFSFAASVISGFPPRMPLAEGRRQSSRCVDGLSALHACDTGCSAVFAALLADGSCSSLSSSSRARRSAALLGRLSRAYRWPTLTARTHFTPLALLLPPADSQTIHLARRISTPPAIPHQAQACTAQAAATTTERIQTSHSMDDITDEEMMALADASTARLAVRRAATASSSSSAASASSFVGAAAASSARPAAPPPTSFQAAFASVTASSLYTSIANMPPPPPPAVSASAGTAAATAPSNRPGTAAAGRGGPAASSSARPVLPSKPTSSTSILVSPRQKGNPVLSHLSNVGWEMAPAASSMSADYLCGDTTCALYLSLKYHCLHRSYLQSRMTSCGSAYTLRVLLLLVDLEDNELPLLEITQACFAFGWTLLCCWSSEEVARYLETLKAYEKKSSALIQERVDDADHAAKLVEALTEVRGINKTDCKNLLHAFGSFAGIARAERDELHACPGMGDRKVARLSHVMNQPFVTSALHRADAPNAGSNSNAAAAAAAHKLAMEKAAAEAALPQKKSAVVFLKTNFTSAPPVPPAPAAAAAAAAPASTAAAASTPSAAAHMPSAFPAPATAAATSARPAATSSSPALVDPSAASAAASNSSSVDFSGFAS